MAGEFRASSVVFLDFAGVALLPVDCTLCANPRVQSRDGLREVHCVQGLRGGLKWCRLR